MQPFPVIFYGQKWRAALTGQANPVNRPISGKIAKNCQNAWNLNFFGPNDFF